MLAYRPSSFETGNPSQLIIEPPTLYCTIHQPPLPPYVVIAGYTHTRAVCDSQTHIVSIVSCFVCGLGMVANQYDLLAWAGLLSRQTRLIQHSRKCLSLKMKRYSGVTLRERSCHSVTCTCFCLLFNCCFSLPVHWGSEWHHPAFPEHLPVSA